MHDDTWKAAGMLLGIVWGSPVGTVGVWDGTRPPHGVEAVHADDTLGMGSAWVLNGLCDAIDAAAPLIPEHPACDYVLPLLDEAEGEGADPSDHLASVLSWAILNHLMMRDHCVLQHGTDRGVSPFQEDV